MRRADAFEAFGGGCDGAGVKGDEVHGCAGRERRGECDYRFGDEASVIGVGFDRVLEEGEGLAVSRDGVPAQRGAELENEAGERGLAIVADGEGGAGGEPGGGRGEMEVEVVSGEGGGGALGFGDGEAGLVNWGFCGSG
jgi:hypothetical protein